MTFEETGFGWSVRMILRNRFLAFQRRGETVVAGLSQKRKNFEHTFAEHLVRREAGDSLHRGIPRDQPAIPIKRKYPVDARVDHPVEQVSGINLCNQKCLFPSREQH